MNDTLRTRLHDLSLDARHLLAEETRSVLGSVYGLSQDGRFESIAKLPAVQSSPEAAETRRRLERYLRDEAAAGHAPAEAVARLTRETAFTHLNRLVAFKLLERKIIRGTVDKYHDSNAFKFYLADHAEDEARYGQGDLPQDALGEGPRDVAYRHFLLWQAAQLAREVPVLFDAQNLASRLFPRPRALRTLIDMLNAPGLHEAWAAGNEETIGWIYQHFNEQEKTAVFERLNKQKQKIRREDLPAATQLFTPRWIVRFLVENTLGRCWLDLHPDSRLASELEYLVPLAQGMETQNLELKTQNSSKLAREITLLDPACGTMHFGLVAYDLFAVMYREEVEHAGETGWPAQASVASVAEIPAAILANNLFGIDIDLRAVQLAALSLYIRAKASNPHATVTPRNLVCTDITVLNGNRLGMFLEALPPGQSQTEAAIRKLWPQLKQAGELGSLLRLENDLGGLVATPRRGRSAHGMARLPGLAETDSQFREFNDLDTQVRATLNTFARQEAERGDDATAFVAGTDQGLKLLDVLARRYDVVVTNPPYMSVRNMSTTLADYLKKAYADGKSDLYAAFIQRCASLLNDNGRLGMITQQSFMFISSYEKLREQLRQQFAIETVNHVGPRAFAEIGGEKVNTVLFVLRREPNEQHRQNNLGTYFRLVREPDAEAKRHAFERALAELNHRGTEAQRIKSVFAYRQGDFDAIPSAPWVYWITNGIKSLFLINPKLQKVAPPKMGMGTRNNERFLRHWWELGIDKIQRNSISIADARLSQGRWFPYMKGGELKRWYGNQERIVNFQNSGIELKEEQFQKYPYIGNNTAWIVPNDEYYFKRGVTYSALGSSGFGARLSPGGFIFDVSGSSLFPDNINLILAILNSPLTAYILQLVNPTINYQVGDLARLPIPTRTSETLEALVKRAIALAKQDSIESETTYDFVAPPEWNHRGTAAQSPQTVGSDALRLAASAVDLSPAERHAELAAVEREINEEVYRLYGIAGEDRRAIEEELSVVSSQLSVEGGSLEIEEDDNENVSESDDEQRTTNNEQQTTDNKQLTTDKLAQRWASYALGVALGRFTPGVPGTIGCGRFTPAVAATLRALADEDGIGLIEAGHPDDLGARVTRALELMHGEDAAQQIITAATGGRTLGEWLTHDFYKEHVRQYRKRPVYWLLQSPGRAYSLLLFHERLTGDSLPLVLGNRYVGGKINGLRAQIGEQDAQINAMPMGRERSLVARRRDAAIDALADAEEFARRIRVVLDARNDRGDVVGWQPQIDDGVLINLAPLYTLIPAWSAEPKKCWQALERGDYDWAHTAMRYWPTRVLEKSKSNKSYAIAHGL